MADVPQLSTGALEAALASENYTGPPICLQVLDVQEIQPKDANPAQGNKRVKITVSDGLWKCSAVLASQLKELVDTHQLVKGAIIEVIELVGNKKLQANPNAALNSKKLLIFLNLTVKGFWQDTIGNPQAFAPDANAGENYPPNPNGAAPAPYRQPPQQQGMNQAPMGGYQNPNPGPSMYGANAGAPVNAYGGNQYGAPPGGNMQQNPYGGPPPAQRSTYGAPPAASGAMLGNVPPQQGGGGYGGPPPKGSYGGGGGGGRMAPMGGGPQYGMVGSAIVRDEAPARIIPISALNPYQGRWTIKARCTQKSEIRRWANARSEGKLMSFDLLDKEGGEIRVTAWNDQVDAYNDLVQVGKVYLISKASLKPRRPQFNNTTHEFEVYLERASTVTLVDEDDETRAIPAVQYHFKKLSELECLEAGVIVDVIGVVDSVEQWQLITRKNGMETRKRSFNLRDDSGRSIEVTLWDKFVTDPGDELESEVRSGGRPVLAIKAVRIGDFNGKNLSTIGSSTVTLNPDVPEAGFLRTWFDHQGGAAQTAAPLSEGRGGGTGKNDRRVTFTQIKDEGLGTHGQADYVAVVGTINFIRNENMWYSACTRDFGGRTCNKKLTENSPGQYYCERCQAACTEPAWRYLLSLQAQDHTAAQWLTAFGDTGNDILGGTSAEELKNHVDSQGFEQMINENNFRTFLFKLKVLQDNYGDENRVKVSISKLTKLDFVAESRVLLENIRLLDQGMPVMQPLPAATGGGGVVAHAPVQQYNAAPQQQQQMQQQQPSPYGGGGNMGMGGNGGFAASRSLPPTNTGHGMADGGYQGGGGYNGGGGNMGMGGNAGGGYGGGNQYNAGMQQGGNAMRPGGGGGGYGGPQGMQTSPYRGPPAAGGGMQGNRPTPPQNHMMQQQQHPQQHQAGGGGGYGGFQQGGGGGGGARPEQPFQQPFAAGWA
eukprot:jgi/Chrzof1/8567/Cz03g15270.t1